MQLKSSYDRLSKWYDLFASPFEKKFIDAGLQKLHASPGETILEIGFGTGQGILKLAPSGRKFRKDLRN